MWFFKKKVKNTSSDLTLREVDSYWAVVRIVLPSGRPVLVGWTPYLETAEKNYQVLLKQNPGNIYDIWSCEKVDTWWRSSHPSWVDSEEQVNDKQCT